MKLSVLGHRPVDHGPEKVEVARVVDRPRIGDLVALAVTGVRGRRRLAHVVAH